MALLPQLARIATPAAQQSMLDTAHALQILKRYGTIMLNPTWVALTAEAGGGSPANTRRVRLDLRRFMRTPVAEGTAIAGTVVVETSHTSDGPAPAAAAGSVDPAPDGDTVGTVVEANYQQPVTVAFACSGGARLNLSQAGGAIGTYIAGAGATAAANIGANGQNRVTLRSAEINPGVDDSQVIDIEIFDTAAETVRVSFEVLDAPAIALSDLDVIFA